MKRLLKRNSASAIACPSEQCQDHGLQAQGNIVLHGYSKVKWGRRRRYRCKSCGKTFGATTGTPYKRLQRSMRSFDRVAMMSVEGVNKSAIARLEGLSWNPVSRWLELAADKARSFNASNADGIELVELQLDELATFLQS